MQGSFLAAAHYDQGRYDLAEQDAHEAQGIIKKLPPGGNYQANLDAMLGRILNRTGRSQEAEPLLRESVGRTDQTFNITWFADRAVRRRLPVYKLFSES